MRAFTAAVAVGILMLGVAAGAASAAQSDLEGIWLPAQRNFFTPAAQQTQPGRPAAREMPPYKPEWEVRYQQLLAESRAGKTKIDPSAQCLPPGMPRMMTTPFPIELSVEKNRVLLLFEISAVRRIWTDGRKHPEGDDLDPTFIGDSIGHWDGDTLVVDTTGLRGDTVFDASGAPHSDKLHVIERIRLQSPDKLEDQMTIDDPVAFTKPWEVTHIYDRKPTWKIMEFVCEENNRNVN